MLWVLIRITWLRQFPQHVFMEKYENLSLNLKNSHHICFSGEENTNYPTQLSSDQVKSREKMSRLTTKQTKSLCAKRSLRSAWASAQSGQSSLCAQRVVKGPSFHRGDSEDSDQTGQMPRLIWVFAGRTCHFVVFVMRRLILQVKCRWPHHGFHHKYLVPAVVFLHSR